MNNAAINAISSGMSYADVSAILGDPGLKDSESVVDGKPTAKYGWTAPNGFMVAATFQEGKLISIAKISEGRSPESMLIVPRAYIDALKSGQEGYVLDNAKYASFGTISAKIPEGGCKDIPANMNGIVGSSANLGEIEQSLGVSGGEYLSSKWKVAIEGTKENFRIAIEGTAPDTKNLGAYYKKSCKALYLDSDPEI